MEYINPLELLEVNSMDSKGIKKAKRRKLAEIELSDNEYIEFQNRKITKSDFLRIVNELDNSEKASFYAYLKSDRGMSNFLSQGDLGVFEQDFNNRFYQKQEFKEFITPFFAQKFSEVFKNAYQRNDSYQIKLLERASVLADTKQTEILYKPTYKLLQNTVKQLQNLCQDVKEEEIDEDELDEVLFDIKRIANTSLINALPSYFKNIRNNIAQEVRNISVNLFNVFNNSEEALEIIKYAQKFRTDNLTNQKIQNDLQQLHQINEERLVNARHQPILQKYAQKLLLIKQVINDLENGNTNIADIKNRLGNFVDINEINNLENVFSQIRTQVALGLRNISIGIWNSLSELDYAIELIKTAKSIKTDYENQKVLTNDYNQLLGLKSQLEANEIKELEKIIDLLKNINQQIQSHGVGGINHEKVQEILNDIFSRANINAFAKISNQRVKENLITELAKLTKNIENSFAKKILTRIKNITNRNSLNQQINSAINDAGKNYRSYQYSKSSQSSNGCITSILGLGILATFVMFMGSLFNTVFGTSIGAKGSDTAFPSDWGFTFAMLGICLALIFFANLVGDQN